MGFTNEIINGVVATRIKYAGLKLVRWDEKRLFARRKFGEKQEKRKKTSAANSTQATPTPKPTIPSCSLFHSFSCCRSVVVMSFLFLMFMTSLPQFHAIAASPATQSQSKLFVQENEDSPCSHQPQDSFSIPTVPASSRQLSGELRDVGNVTTLAGGTGSSGSTNGVGTIALFNDPTGVSISPDGVYALVADFENHQIRHIVISTASVATLAGVALSTGSTNGVGTTALFSRPVRVCISPDGVFALVAEFENHLIRHIIISTASVTTLAGVAGFSGSTNGVGAIAQFNAPIGVCISPDGVFALVADRYNHLIRHIIISTASVTTLVGVAGSFGSTNGVGAIAQFNNPIGVSISPDGVFALVADQINHLIRHIIISTASVTTLVGVAGFSGSTNGVGTIAQFNNPYGVSISPDGVFALVADYDNNLIRQIIISTASVTTLVGVAGFSGSTNGVGTIAQFNNPIGVSISPDGVFALVADRINQLIRHIIISRVTPSVFPSPTPSFSPTNLPSVPPITRFSFGVKIGDEGILSPDQAIVVDYLQDARRGQTILHSTNDPPDPSYFVPGKMIPISGIVNASLVSSDSDPPLSSDSILIKWRPVTAGGIGSWDTGGNHTIITSGGAVFVSWLVSLLSEEIMGFIVQGLPVFPMSSFLLSSRQLPSPQPITSTSSSTCLLLEDSPLLLIGAAVMVIALSPSPTLPSLSPSLPTRPSHLGPFARIFAECLTSVSIS
jgi:DNA-binding beta-propeller fold protein YncE